jgi:hypothetical protein
MANNPPIHTDRHLSSNLELLFYNLETDVALWLLLVD